MQLPYAFVLLAITVAPLACGGEGSAGADDVRGGLPTADAPPLFRGERDAGGGAAASPEAGDVGGGGDGGLVVGGDGGQDVVSSDLPRVDPDGDTVSDCRYGAIRGLVCSVSEQVFVAGASVWVDAVDCHGVPIQRLTTSDEDGYYTLIGVPIGPQTVFAEKDTFSYEYSVLVEDGAVTDVSALAAKECREAAGDLCVAGHDDVAVESQLTSGSADIIWFVDTSGSMEAEANWVQQNINAFAQYIGAVQIDYHVILIADGYDLCVPPPLGGPGCSDGPRFRHVHASVGSNDGLERVIETYSEYSDFLRADATTNFVAVTDDNSDESAAWFETEVAAQTNPGFSDPFVFHSIVAYGTIPFIGCITGAFAGWVYMQLTEETGGAKFPICRTDWASIFSELAETVVQTVQSTCSYALPDPESAAAADQVSVVYLVEAQSTPIPEVVDADSCGPQGGWYIDHDGSPASLVLCPASCGLLSGGVLRISYDCLP